MAGESQPFETSPVVVGVNGRDEGRDALAAADALAAGLGRPLLVVCTYPSLLSPSPVAAAELRAQAEAVLADAIAEVRADI